MNSRRDYGVVAARCLRPDCGAWRDDVCAAQDAEPATAHARTTTPAAGKPAFLLVISAWSNVSCHIHTAAIRISLWIWKGNRFFRSCSNQFRMSHCHRRFKNGIRFSRCRFYYQRSESPLHVNIFCVKWAIPFEFIVYVCMCLLTFQRKDFTRFLAIVFRRSSF